MVENTAPNDNEPINQKLLISLATKKIKGEDLDLNEIIQFVDLNADYQQIKDWTIKEKIATPKDWVSAIKTKQVKDHLGGYPKTVTEFVEMYVKKNRIDINFKKQITHDAFISINGEDLKSKIDDKENDIKTGKVKNIHSANRQLRALKEQQSCLTPRINLNDLSRKLRILAKEMELNFSGNDIEDVVQELIFNIKPKRLSSVFNNISFAANGGAKNYPDQQLWVELAESFFSRDGDLSRITMIAMIKKFIWQVKRKMLGLPITNHAMVVLLGRQGIGKSTFMSKLFGPVREFSASTDFQQISDDRNIDLWENYCLEFDEMGYATKADVSIIKNIITSPILTRRYMRTNSATPIPQNATLIGASNKNIEQLVRDETGIRRFHAISCSESPNWKRLNDVDVLRLWQSVDELAEDPTLEFMDEIVAWQESCRVKTSAEIWARSINPGMVKGKAKNDQEWFKLYKDWEIEYFPKKRMDMDEWLYEIKRIIENDPKFPFSLNTGTEFGTSFIYDENVAKERATLKERNNKFFEENNIKYIQHKLDLFTHFKHHNFDKEWTSLDTINDPDVLEYADHLTLIENYKEYFSSKGTNKEIQPKRVSLRDSGVLTSNAVKHKFFPNGDRYLKLVEDNVVEEIPVVEEIIVEEPKSKVEPVATNKSSKEDKLSLIMSKINKNTGS